VLTRLRVDSAAFNPRKSDYHELAAFVPAELIDPEVGEKLDRIETTARNARPRSD
jgi:hypothetical protein